MTKYTDNLNLFEYEPDKDGKKTFNITKALNENWDKLDIAVDGKQDTLTAGNNIKIENNVISLDEDFVNQSKALYTGQVSDNPIVYADVEKAYHSSFDLSKFTIVGSPAITADGIASEFSNVNRILTTLIDTTQKNYCIKLGNYEYKGSSSFIFGTPFTSDKRAFDLVFANNHIFLYLTSNGSTWNVSQPTENTGISKSVFSSGEKLDISFVRENGNKYKVLVYNHSTNIETTEIEIESDEDLFSDINNKIYLGSLGPAWQYYTGSIDLKQFLIKVDNIEVFSGNETGLDVIKPNNYTVVGSPVITADGIASGFSTDNYLKISKNFDFTRPFVIEGSFTTGEIVAKEQFVFSTTIKTGITIPFQFGMHTNSKVIIYTPNHDGTSQQFRMGEELIANTKYFYKLSFDGDIFKAELGKTKNNLTAFFTTLPGQAPNFQSTNFLNIGIASNYVAPFLGAIDLNSFKIYVDENLVYQPCLKIPYTLSKTGSKIVDAVYRDRVKDVYEQYGLAMYYSIDEENQNLTLPMGEIYGMIEKTSDKLLPLIASKQDNLIAGESININNNIISANLNTTFCINSGNVDSYGNADLIDAVATIVITENTEETQNVTRTVNQQYTTPGTYTFNAPVAGYYTVTVVGGGGSGGLNSGIISNGQVYRNGGSGGSGAGFTGQLYLAAGNYTVTVGGINGASAINNLIIAGGGTNGGGKYGLNANGYAGSGGVLSISGTVQNVTLQANGNAGQAFTADISNTKNVAGGASVYNGYGAGGASNGSPTTGIVTLYLQYQETITTGGTTETVIPGSSSVNYKIGGTYASLKATNINGHTFTINGLNTDNISSLPDGTYYKFVGVDGSSELLKNKIFKQTQSPSASTGDIWLNTAIEPLHALQWDGTQWISFNKIPIAGITIANGVVSSFVTFPYNQNGYNANMKSPVGKPSGQYQDLQLPASGGTVIAPYNGHVQLAALACESMQLYNNSRTGYWDAIANQAGNAVVVTVPCQKGDKIQIYYNITTHRYFRCYADEGAI